MIWYTISRKDFYYFLVVGRLSFATAKFFVIAERVPCGKICWQFRILIAKFSLSTLRRHLYSRSKLAVCYSLYAINIWPWKQ